MYKQHNSYSYLARKTALTKCFNPFPQICPQMLHFLRYEPDYRCMQTDSVRVKFFTELHGPQGGAHLHFLSSQTPVYRWCTCLTWLRDVRKAVAVRRVVFIISFLPIFT